jgi:hypothetical protein
MTQRPDTERGPRGFVRRWLRFDAGGPSRRRVAWKLIATLALYLIASALLAAFSGDPQH